MRWKVLLGFLTLAAAVAGAGVGGFLAGREFTPPRGDQEYERLAAEHESLTVRFADLQERNYALVTEVGAFKTEVAGLQRQLREAKAEPSTPARAAPARETPARTTPARTTPARTTPARTTESSSNSAGAEDRRKGFHCLSAWDGNHDGLEALIRDRLNDPDSMETTKTEIAPVDEDGDHLIRLTFTAKNAFGGRVRNVAYGWVDHDTCKATLIGIE